MVQSPPRQATHQPIMSQCSLWQCYFLVSHRPEELCDWLVYLEPAGYYAFSRIRALPLLTYFYGEVGGGAAARLASAQIV